MPGTPGTPVAGTITDTSVALSWAASSGTVTGYRVYEGSTVVSSPSGTSATISGSFVPPTGWPSIRGAMTWSINWDASNGYAFANSVHAHLVAMP